MGSGVTTQRWGEDCNPYIAISDIQKLKRRGNLTRRDQNVLQAGISLIADSPSWVWRNAQIELYGDNLYECLYAGSRSNRFIVNLTQEGYGTARTSQESWRLKIRNAAVSVWEFCKQNAGTLLGVAGAVTKAIAFHEFS